MNIQKRNYKNNELNIEINCYVDNKNEIWFKAKEIAMILEYKDTKKAIQDHVHQDDKKLMDLKIKTYAKSLNSRGVIYPLVLRALKRPSNVSL